MKKDYTKIVFVVDRSGSMSNISNDIIGGYNKFITDQKALKHGTCDVSFYQFDNVYEAVYENTPVDKVKELDDKTFVPRGGTALLDAVGRTITSVGKQLAGLAEEERPDRVLVVILTDGYENASREYSGEKVKALVEEQTNKYQWQFTYIGANQDAWDVGTSLGIKAASNLTFASNVKGSARAFASLNTVTKAYRSAAGGQSAAANFGYTVADLESQKDAGANITLANLASAKQP